MTTRAPARDTRLRGVAHVAPPPVPETHQERPVLVSADRLFAGELATARNLADAYAQTIAGFTGAYSHVIVRVDGGPRPRLYVLHPGALPDAAALDTLATMIAGRVAIKPWDFAHFLIVLYGADPGPAPLVTYTRATDMHYNPTVIPGELA